MAILSDLISRVRTAIDDVAGDKSVFRENLGRSINGNQVTLGSPYQLNNKRVAAGSLTVNVDGGGFKAIGSGGGQYPGTEDDARGRFTLVTPAASSLFATYDFLFMSDTEITDFVNQAADFIGTSDPTTVAVGLLDALTLKAASDACFAIAARAASYYNFSAGGKAAQKGDISKKYQGMAKDLFERAVAERLSFYGERKGKSTAAVAKRFATKQKVWAPRR